MKRVTIYMFTLLLVVLPVSAAIISTSPVDPILDGILKEQEYSNVQIIRGMKLGYTLSRDEQTLHFTIEAPTKGWVSIGLGSNRMQGAHMIIGFDGANGQVISEETGRGHTHSASRDKIAKQHIVKESGNTTTLEFSVPSSLYSKDRELRIILAYGSADNLTSKHVAYGNFTISFSK